MKLTLDTNCIINLLDRSSATATSWDELSSLIRLALSGHADIAITTRAEADLLNDKDHKRKSEMLRQLALFPVVGSVARWDVSSWDSGDVWEDEKTAQLSDDLRKLLFPGLTPSDKRYGNKVNDIDHLVGHLINRRDIFVTDDRVIVGKAAQLKVSPGIVVMTPQECLTFIEGIERRNQHQLLKSAILNEKYHTRGLRGSVTFDYSNNNHSYTIGEGYFLFETRWSKASDTAIHAYSDAPSIEAIALAKGFLDISDIQDASAFDFSSRDRRPSTGQIVVWRNLNGLYAATKIVDIKDDRQGPEADELTFEYVILDGGTNDFGSRT
jgi:hypothetical protein